MDKWKYIKHGIIPLNMEVLIMNGKIKPHT